MTERIDANTSGSTEFDLFAEGPVVVFTWHNESGWPVEYVSPNVDRLFGYSPTELCDGDPAYIDLVHEDDRERVTQEVKDHSNGTTERFHHEPYRMVTKGGEVRWVLDHTRIVREDGEITGYMGYIVDITERKKRLEYVTELNETIRSLHEILIDVRSRERIHQAVCRSIADLEGFGGVWIGTVGPSAEALVPVARCDVPDSRLEDIPLSLGFESPVPAVRVADERPTTGEHRVPERLPEGPWRAAMLAEGYRSVFAVPIHHEGIHHGVLTIYGTTVDTFDGRIRDILTELGALVGYAVTALERRNALHTDGSRDLVLGVAIEQDEPLRVLARRLSRTVEVRSVSRRTEDEFLLYCLLSDVTPERVVDAADTAPEIRSVECLPGTGTSIYEVLVEEPCVASAVTTLGASFRSLRVSEHDCELAVSICRERDEHRLIGQAQELFGDAELKAERAAAPTEATPWPTLLAGVLTARQRDVLRTAYHAGYFDETRKRTGAEIADSLGIAQPTFSTHVRAAQRNLLSAIWDDPGDG